MDFLKPFLNDKMRFFVLVMRKKKEKERITYAYFILGFFRILSCWKIIILVFLYIFLLDAFKIIIKVIIFIAIILYACMNGVERDGNGVYYLLCFVIFICYYIFFICILFLFRFYFHFSL